MHQGLLAIMAGASVTKAARGLKAGHHQYHFIRPMFV